MYLKLIILKFPNYLSQYKVCDVIHSKFNLLNIAAFRDSVTVLNYFNELYTMQSIQLAVLIILVGGLCWRVEIIIKHLKDK